MDGNRLSLPYEIQLLHCCEGSSNAQRSTVVSLWLSCPRRSLSLRAVSLLLQCPSAVLLLL